MLEAKDTRTLKGKRGEMNAYADLVCWPGPPPPDPHYVLRNLYIPNPGGKTAYSQIDLIYLHTSGVYVIEVKDWDGRIYADEKWDHWKQVIPDWDKGCKRNEDSLGNPLRQNGRHMEALRKMFEHDFDALPMHSIAVYTDERCRIIRFDYPWEKPVVYLRDLRAAIQCIARENANRLLPGHVRYLHGRLQPWQDPPEAVVQQHIDEVRILRNRTGRQYG